MEYQIILTTVIVLIAVMTGLGFIFNLLLKPINERLSKLEGKLDKLLAQSKA